MDTTNGKLGFITMAFGQDKYFNQANALARSLKRHMPGIPIAIISDRSHSSDLFDYSVKMPTYSVAGTVHKKMMYELSPFSESLFIDSDCLITRPFHTELAEIKKYDFTPIVSRYLSSTDEDYYVDNMTVALMGVGGTLFPKFNGGVYFFRKSALANLVFQTAEDILLRQNELGIKNFDKSGPGEETLISLALAQLGDIALYDDRGTLMRTPLGIIGRLKLDVLGGGCEFNKSGELVSPAICHFCGEWVDSTAYKMAVWSLEVGRSPSPSRYGFNIFYNRLARIFRLFASRAHLLMSEART